MNQVLQYRAWRTYQTESGAVCVHRLAGPDLGKLIEAGRARGYGPCGEAVIAKVLQDSSTNAGFLLALKASGAFEVLVVWGAGGVITTSEASPEGVIRAKVPWWLLMADHRP